jgi:hypothetical protein
LERHPRENRQSTGQGAFGSVQSPPLKPYWHFEYVGSVQSASLVQCSEQKGAALPPPQAQLRPLSQGRPQAGEKVVQIPAAQVTAAVVPYARVERSSVVGGPLAQPQAG